MATRTTQPPATGQASRRAKPDFTPADLHGFLGRLPAYGYAGAVPNLLAWISSWGRIGPWRYTFFALWFGFILLLDGLSVAVSGSSPLRRSLPRFALLFAISSLFWWVFEGLNVP